MREDAETEITVDRSSGNIKLLTVLSRLKKLEENTNVSTNRDHLLRELESVRRELMQYLQTYDFSDGNNVVNEDGPEARLEGHRDYMAMALNLLDEITGKSFPDHDIDPNYPYIHLI